MKLYLIRHAEALSAGTGPIQDDADRPLSAGGRREARRAAERLRESGVRLDRILVSPLMRAVQTAEIHACLLSYDGVVESWPFLGRSGRWREQLEQVLVSLAAEGASSIAVVGHNPDMSDIASSLLGIPDGAFPFRAGVVCALELPGASLERSAKLGFWLDPVTGRFHREI